MLYPGSYRPGARHRPRAANRFLATPFKEEGSLFENRNVILAGGIFLYRGWRKADHRSGAFLNVHGLIHRQDRVPRRKGQRTAGRANAPRCPASTAASPARSSVLNARCRKPGESSGASAAASPARSSHPSARCRRLLASFMSETLSVAVASLRPCVGDSTADRRSAGAARDDDSEHRVNDDGCGGERGCTCACGESLQTGGR